MLGKPVKLLRKLAVDRGEVSPVGAFRSTALLDRPRAVIVGIVRHEGRNERNCNWVRTCKQSLWGRPHIMAIEGPVRFPAIADIQNLSGLRGREAG